MADSYFPRLDQLVHEDLIAYVQNRFVFTTTDWADGIDD
jgi:hypothetical protein